MILSLDVNELVFSDSLKDLHLIPFDNNVLHVSIRCKEANNAIGDDLTELNE